ncbi:hypothetical protein JAAARDRAFT_46100 [Jaapia argillacea MUCL 33604]|uniref:Uncharacterized protein n=1 Tax=Jaapia argillacea MUCL 33604 TaxID=933084 RepID=A0A067Q2M3_9AGAM|nr:hypothetical protein JAAARDRAFT_46100 [Jaapia argillacea MUCL 33604]
MFARFSLAATVAALFTAVAAQTQLSIIDPGGPNLWWIAKSANTLIWTCEQTTYQNFTVMIANSNPSVLVAPQAVIAIQQNFQCSLLIQPNQLDFPPSTGYTVQFANVLNSTDVYASSQPFEIKALGAAYPASSATPTSTASSTASGSGSGATASSTSKSGAFSNAQVPLALGGMAVIGAVAGLL